MLRDSEPCVGIFWIHRGEAFGAALPLTKGVRTSLGIVDTDVDHATWWETDTAVRVRFPELRELEYFEVPRGRVLFDASTKHSIVYADRRLLTPQGKKSIAHFFLLKGRRTRWSPDPHYVTD